MGGFHPLFLAQVWVWDMGMLMFMLWLAMKQPETGPKTLVGHTPAKTPLSAPYAQISRGLSDLPCIISEYLFLVLAEKMSFQIATHHYP